MPTRVSFDNATFEQLLELFRILPEIRSSQMDNLLAWTDDKGVIVWFNATAGTMPRGWRFRNEQGGWAGQ